MAGVAASAACGGALPRGVSEDCLLSAMEGELRRQVEDQERPSADPAQSCEAERSSAASQLLVQLRRLQRSGGGGSGVAWGDERLAELVDLLVADAPSDFLSEEAAADARALAPIRGFLLRLALLVQSSFQHVSVETLLALCTPRVPQPLCVRQDRLLFLQRRRRQLVAAAAAAQTSSAVSPTAFAAAVAAASSSWPSSRRDGRRSWFLLQNDPAANPTAEERAEQKAAAASEKAALPLLLEAALAPVSFSPGEPRSLLLSLRARRRGFASEKYTAGGRWLRCGALSVGGVSVSRAVSAAAEAASFGLDVALLGGGGEDCEATQARSCAASALASASPTRLPAAAWLAAAKRFRRNLNVWGHQSMTEEERRIIDSNPHQQHIVRDPAAVYVVRFDHSGSVVLTGGVDGLVKVWDAASGQLLYSLLRHAGDITDIAVHPSNCLLASCCGRGEVRLWRLLPNAWIPVGGIDVGRRVIFVRFFDARRKQPFSAPRGGAAEDACRLPPGGCELLLVCSDSELLVFDLGQILREAALNVGGALSVQPIQKATWGRSFFPRAMDCAKVPCDPSGGYLVALGLDEDSSVADSDSDGEEARLPSCVAAPRSSSRGGVLGAEGVAIEGRLASSHPSAGKPAKKRQRRSKAFLFKTPGFRDLQRLRGGGTTFGQRPDSRGLAPSMLCVADLSAWHRCFPDVCFANSSFDLVTASDDGVVLLWKLSHASLDSRLSGAALEALAFVNDETKQALPALARGRRPGSAHQAPLLGTDKIPRVSLRTFLKQMLEENAENAAATEAAAHSSRRATHRRRLHRPQRRRRGQAESWLSSASSSLSSEVEEVEVLSEGRPFARGWGEERCGCLRAGLDACSDPVECLALKLRHHQTLAERSALGATAAGLAGSSRASSWDYGLSCLCFTLDDLLICVAERCVAKTNAASFSSPPPPEFAAVADAGVSLFDAHSGERVALALHGQLRRAVSCMRPHPACAQLLLVAVYDGDVVLLDLTDARAAALAVRKSSGEAPVQPTKAFSGASQRASVFCPALRRLRLGTQCCWLDAEWAPGGSQAALGHRFGCVSFFGFGSAPAMEATFPEQFLSVEFVETLRTEKGLIADAASGTSVHRLPRGALLDAGGRSFPFHAQPPPPRVEALGIGCVNAALYERRLLECCAASEKRSLRRPVPAPPPMRLLPCECCPDVADALFCLCCGARCQPRLPAVLPPNSSDFVSAETQLKKAAAAPALSSQVRRLWLRPSVGDEASQRAALRRRVGQRLLLEKPKVGDRAASGPSGQGWGEAGSWSATLEARRVALAFEAVAEQRRSLQNWGTAAPSAFPREGPAAAFEGLSGAASQQQRLRLFQVLRRHRLDHRRLWFAQRCTARGNISVLSEYARAVAAAREEPLLIRPPLETERVASSFSERRSAVGLGSAASAQRRGGNGASLFAESSDSREEGSPGRLGGGRRRVAASSHGHRSRADVSSLRAAPASRSRRLLSDDNSQDGGGSSLEEFAGGAEEERGASRSARRRLRLRRRLQGGPSRGRSSSASADNSPAASSAAGETLPLAFSSASDAAVLDAEGGGDDSSQDELFQTPNSSGLAAGAAERSSLAHPPSRLSLRSRRVRGGRLRFGDEDGSSSSAGERQADSGDSAATDAEFVGESRGRRQPSALQRRSCRLAGTATVDAIAMLSDPSISESAKKELLRLADFEELKLIRRHARLMQSRQGVDGDAVPSQSARPPPQRLDAFARLVHQRLNLLGRFPQGGTLTAGEMRQLREDATLAVKTGILANQQQRPADADALVEGLRNILLSRAGRLAATGEEGGEALVAAAQALLPGQQSPLSASWEKNNEGCAACGAAQRHRCALCGEDAEHQPLAMPSVWKPRSFAPATLELGEVVGPFRACGGGGTDEAGAGSSSNSSSNSSSSSSSSSSASSTRPPSRQAAQIWLHTRCLMSVTGLDFDVHSRGFYNLKELVATAQKRRCGYCGQTGAAVKCCTAACLSFFHYPCALKAYLVGPSANAVAANEAKREEAAAKTKVVPDPLYFGNYLCLSCRMQRTDPKDPFLPYWTGDALTDLGLRQWLSNTHRCEAAGAPCAASTLLSRGGGGAESSSLPFRVSLRSTVRARGSGKRPGRGAVSPCCFNAVGVYVPQLGDIVRYFPQLHKPPLLLHDRLQLWNPDCCVPFDAAVVDICYEFPGLPIGTEAQHIAAKLTLEVLNPEFLAGSRVALHYTPSENSADFLVPLFDVLRGQQRTLLLLRDAATGAERPSCAGTTRARWAQASSGGASLTRSDSGEGDLKEEESKEQVLRDVSAEALSRCPLVRVYIDGRYFSAFVRRVRRPHPATKAAAPRSGEAGGDAAGGFKREGLSQSTTPESEGEALAEHTDTPAQAAAVDGRKDAAEAFGQEGKVEGLGDGVAACLEGASSNCLAEVLGGDVYPPFQTFGQFDFFSLLKTSEKKPEEGGGGESSSAGRVDSETEAASWLRVSSLGVEALEVVYLADGKKALDNLEASGPPQWLNSWEVDFNPGERHEEQLEIQRLLQEVEFPSRRQKELLAHLDDLIAQPTALRGGGCVVSSSSSLPAGGGKFREFFAPIPEYPPDPAARRMTAGWVRDYWRVVALPLDLRRVRERLCNGFYRREAALHADLRLLLDNCRLFNQPEDPIALLASELEAELEARRLLPTRAVQQALMRRQLQEQYFLAQVLQRVVEAHAADTLRVERLAGTRRSEAQQLEPRVSNEEKRLGVCQTDSLSDAQEPKPSEANLLQNTLHQEPRESRLSNNLPPNDIRRRNSADPPGRRGAALAASEQDSFLRTKTKAEEAGAVSRANESLQASLSVAEHKNDAGETQSSHKFSAIPRDASGEGLTPSEAFSPGRHDPDQDVQRKGVPCSAALGSSTNFPSRGNNRPEGASPFHSPAADSGSAATTPSRRASVQRSRRDRRAAGAARLTSATAEGCVDSGALSKMHFAFPETSCSSGEEPAESERARWGATDARLDRRSSAAHSQSRLGAAAADRPSKRQACSSSAPSSPSPVKRRRPEPASFGCVESIPGRLRLRPSQTETPEAPLPQLPPSVQLQKRLSEAQQQQLSRSRSAARASRRGTARAAQTRTAGGAAEGGGLASDEEFAKAVQLSLISYEEERARSRGGCEQAETAAASTERRAGATAARRHRHSRRTVGGP